MKRVKTLPVIILLVVFLVLGAAFVIPTFFYQTHFLPGTQINCPSNEAKFTKAFKIENLTLTQAQNEIAQNLACPLPQEIVLTFDGEKVASMPAQNLDLQFDFKPGLENLLARNNPFSIWQNLLPFFEVSAPEFAAPAVIYNRDTLEKFVVMAGAGLYQAVTPPDYELLPRQEIEIEAGGDGQAVATSQTLDLLADNFENFNFSAPLVMSTLPWKWSETQLATIAATLSAPVKEPILKIENNQVQEFVPPTNGQEFDQATFLQIATQSGTLELPIKILHPQGTLAGSNELGIQELIGFGESWYDHSIAGRIHNVALTADKLNNFLLAPGEEFSFNQALGEVSGATGFRPGYVIQGGRSVLADGGGVCQVSSTLFRALLDAGVKITRRIAHSYRVSYYEIGNKPGFDATVYSGNIDLRFVNDTPGHILIAMTTDSKNLYMTVSLYGTSDGRRSEILDYKQWDARGAPPTEYIEDPSLPPGARQQIDFATGGIKAQFRNVVYNADGSVRYDDTYYSSYQPWSAKFLVGPNP